MGSAAPESSGRDTAHTLVVIPCLNEARHLPGLLAWLRERPEAARIVIADGGSTDGSREIVTEAARTDPRVVLLDNAARIQSAGVNLAVRLYGGSADTAVRIDAHARYPKDYLTRLLQAHAESGADSVVVSMHATAHSNCFQRAAACAQNSVLGAGGARHRKANAQQWVDHGHHALLSVAPFVSVGGYDESFSHNEDAELDARLTQRGGKILLADIAIDYFPRCTAPELAQQYYNFGRGRARTALKHRAPLKPRQLIPLLVPPLALLGLVIAPIFPLAAVPFTAWVGGSLLYGVVLGIRAQRICAYASGVAALIMHTAWSAGFLRQFLFRRAAPFGAHTLRQRET